MSALRGYSLLRIEHLSCDPWHRRRPRAATQGRPYSAGIGSWSPRRWGTSIHPTWTSVSVPKMLRNPWDIHRNPCENLLSERQRCSKTFRKPWKTPTFPTFLLSRTLSKELRKDLETIGHLFSNRNAIWYSKDRSLKWLEGVYLELDSRNILGS